MRHEVLAQQGLQSSSGGLPFRRINFVLAQRPDSHNIAPSVDLHPLNAEMPSMLANKGGGLASTPSALADRGFFPESNVSLTWSGPRKAGSGLVNLGNTCFMNSVLQCLTHTPPLAELCIRDQNVSSVPAGQLQQNLDPIAATQMHIKRALTGSQAALQPKWHARNLKAINRRFRLGRQEDAHEYLRCVLDAMHEAFLKHIKPKPPPELAATTFVQRIFGGKLRSQIVCEGVDYTSSTIDPFLDLSLEINKANSLAKALQHFTAAEILDGDNRYRCPKNNKLVRAHKRISIDLAPNVLTVHLKRFDFFGRGHKLGKKVEFDFELDLAPYMTHQHHRHAHKQQQQHGHHHHGHRKPVMYDLYAVLVHLGHSLHSGHYVCYVKAGNGMWHLCDDHKVAQVSQRVVEGQHAYILFYIKRQPKGSAGTLPAAVAAAAQNVVVAGNKHAAAAKPQQQLTSSDASTKTPLAGRVAAAIAQGKVVPAVAGSASSQQQLPVQQPQQQQQTSAVLAKQPAAVSLAEGVAEGGQKVITSSTESTCTASPVPAKEPRSLDAVESPQPRDPQPALHSHHYVTRSRPAHLSSFSRHMQIHQELVKLRSSRRRQRLAVAAVAAELQSAAISDSTEVQQQQQQQHLSGQANGAHSSVVIDLGVIGSKRQRQELPVQQPDLSDSKKQRLATKQQQSQHPTEQEDHVAAQQEQQTRGQLRRQQQQREQLPHAQVQPVEQAHTHQRKVPPPVHQQQSSVSVTGAAALEIVMAGVGSTTGSWEGGDEQLAAQASALQKVSSRKQRERDEWDAEYDRGKVKKVRKKEQQQDDADDGPAGNRFQAAWDQQLPQKARKEAWRADNQQQRDGSRRGRGRGRHGAGFSRGGSGAFRARGGRGAGRGGRGGGRGDRGGGGRGGFRGRGGGGQGRGRGRR